MCSICSVTPVLMRKHAVCTPLKDVLRVGTDLSSERASFQAGRPAREEFLLVVYVTIKRFWCCDRVDDLGLVRATHPLV